MMNSSINAAFEAVSGYTAFDNCPDIQFEVGKTLEYERKTKSDKNGFYFCHKNPIFALTYYHLFSREWSPTGFAEVSTKTVDYLMGQKEEVCIASKIKVNKLLTLDELIEAQIKASYQSQNVNYIATKDIEKLSSNDDFAIIASDKKWTSASISGDCSAIVTKDGSHLSSSGYGGALLSIGPNAQLTASGNCSYLYANGNDAKVSTSGLENHVNVIGHRSHVTSSGDYDNIYTDGDDTNIVSGGDDAGIRAVGDRVRIAAMGNYCDIWYRGSGGFLQIGGYRGKFDCSEGTLVQAVVYDSELNPSGDLIGRIGKNGLKPNTEYTVQYGKFVEVAAEEAEIE